MKLLSTLGIIVFISTYLFASTDANIKTNQGRLKNIDKEKATIDKKLNKLGNEININAKKVKSLEVEINNIEHNIKINEKLYYNELNEYKKLQDRQVILDKERQKIQKEIVEVLSTKMLIINALNLEEPLSATSIIEEEILKRYNNDLQKYINHLGKNVKKIEDMVKKTETKMIKIEQYLGVEISKRTQLKENKKSLDNMNVKLNKDIANYHSKLKKIEEERRDLQKILEELKIVKKQDATQQQKQQQKKEEHQTAEERRRQAAIPIEVRKLASSYRAVSTTKYKGVKTIAPLNNYVVENKYGPYFDPVYKIKVFNEFIGFSTKSSNSPIFSVLDGKIVFAKKTSILKGAIVIEHKDKYHSIYSLIDRIKVKVGDRVKKGDIIAWTDERLNFEVTKEDKHINPEDFILLK